eukprot:scaffold17563_cov117-Isochrysis_galbana.AAC.2
MSTDVRLTKRYKKIHSAKKKLPCMHTDRQQQQANDASGRTFVASAVVSIFILSLGAAKFRPITVTDVQSDGRPLALPGDTHGKNRTPK